MRLSITYVRFALCLISALFFSTEVYAERYRVAEDSFGQTHALEVGQATSSSASDQEADPSPLSEPSLTQEQQSDVSISDSSDAASDDSVAKVKTDEISGSIEDQQTEAQNIEESTLETIEPEKQKALSIFEQKYLEGIEAERQQVLELIQQNEGENAYDATSLEGQRFVDGDALEQSGGIQDESKAPYFIEVGADGRPRITAYDPVLEKAFQKAQREKKYEFTSATIYKREQDEKSKLELPGTADPVAKAILLEGKKEFDSYFEEFSKFCCEQLINKNLETMEKGRAYYFELTEEDLAYRFQEGDSRYILVKLPRSTSKNYPLRFRTFIRKYRDKGIEQGVFFPQIVTLDKYKEPLRIITGPLLKYVPENWVKYGYLEGVFEMDQTREREEVYLLAKTNRDILKQSSVIESEEEVAELEHIGFGSFELEILVD